MRYILLLLVPAFLLAGCETGSRQYSLQGDSSADLQKARAYEYSDTMTPGGESHAAPDMSSHEDDDD